ncbi:MAG: radical SAM protein [Candidatus Dadabacteria bacterium]|nr:radical SAM protein [Candidatus Dadabacteria bacterium]NIS08213.1 radical SAM protein [Candidatus Dadabacteria bacterium]NIV41480.1 radical SAM protein [Candidatus Dadabacteria bacterium]NIX15123.1 radical SAM protein [Candidatus Dadabacteria bacterium]NIY21701.1 radical SAM protein [Candidatus Dadabacteria bacterium]
MKDCVPGVAKFLYMKAARRPKLVNLEITKLCNAGCDFCDYWQTKHEERLTDYGPVIEKINPLAVVITGGEPMLRKDLVNIVRQVKGSTFYVFTSMVTKGDLLTVEKAHDLFNAGLDQIAVSLDFIGKTHDKYRGIDGLWDYLEELLPNLGKEFKGKKSVIINTIIMDDNLDQIVDLVHQAKEWNIGVSFSSYSVMKTNNESHYIDTNLQKVTEVVDELIRLRKELKGTILTTEYYLKEIPGYFKRGGVPDCTAGLSHIQVTPSGHLKRCSEMPVSAHYTEYTPDLYQKTNCDACWFSCRGETQSPANVQRALEYLGVWV